MPRMAAAGSRLYPHDSRALIIFVFSSLSSFSFIVVGVSSASSREKVRCSGWNLSQTYFLTASSITLTSSRTFPGQGYASSLCLALLLSLRLSSKCSKKNVAIGTMSVTVSLSGGILTTSSQMQSRKCCVIKPSLTSSSGDFAEVHISLKSTKRFLYEPIRQTVFPRFYHLFKQILHTQGHFIDILQEKETVTCFLQNAVC